MYNIDTRAADFVNYFRNMSTHYRSKHLLHTFGEDFEFHNAQMFYKNLDKLFKYVNDHYDDINVMYSTPS